MMSSYLEGEVLITGGIPFIVRPWDKGIVDELAIDFIRQFRVDYAIIDNLGDRDRRHPARLRHARGPRN